MPTSPVIVAHDGSPNADDALALGRALASAGDAPLALASTYRPAPAGPRDGEGPTRERDRFMRARTQELLVDAARSLGVAEQSTYHAVASATTAEGIRALAERERAQIVVFGSARGTPPGHVHPGSASRRLLADFGSALAFAPAGFASRSIGERHAGFTVVAVALDDSEQTARRSAQALAQRAQGRVLDGVPDAVGDGLSLLLLGSVAQARAGRLMVNARANELIQTVGAPVLVLARGRVLPAGAGDAAVAA
jgi:nucleotide-binding universal stress UspA family protein